MQRPLSCEVVQPRSYRWLLAAIFATGACTAAVHHAAHDSAIGVPLSVWRSETPTAYFSRPAVLCIVNRRLESPVWGTSWRCPEREQ